MRIFPIILAAALAVLSVPQPVWAQAMAAPAAGTVLVPTSGWLVGPSTLASDDGGALPCIMVNQFDNGFALRISGGDGQIYGIVLDVRQNIFNPGQDYALPVAIEPDFSRKLQAQAFDAATLIINTQDIKGLYKALEETRAMTITLGKQELQFIMLGARDGLRRIESCYSGQGTGTPAPAPQRRTALDDEQPDPPAQPAGMHEAGNGEGVAAAYRKLMAQKDNSAGTDEPGGALAMGDIDQGVIADTGPETAAAAPDPEPAPAPAPGSDEKLTAMLERAAQRLAGPPPSVIPDLSLGGNSRNAKQIQTVKPGAAVPTPAQPAAPAAAQPNAVYSGGALARNWTQPAPAAPQVAAVAAPQVPAATTVRVPGATPAPYTAAQAAAAPQKGTMVRRQWEAGAGDGLQQVLGQWAETAHVRLDWLAGDNVRLRAPVAAEGSFESAVSQAFGQFKGTDNAPVGQIYYDKTQGQKVLIVTRP